MSCSVVDYYLQRCCCLFTYLLERPYVFISWFMCLGCSNASVYNWNLSSGQSNSFNYMTAVFVWISATLLKILIKQKGHAKVVPCEDPKKLDFYIINDLVLFRYSLGQWTHFKASRWLPPGTCYLAMQNLLTSTTLCLNSKGGPSPPMVSSSVTSALGLNDAVIVLTLFELSWPFCNSLCSANRLCFRSICWHTPGVL